MAREEGGVWVALMLKFMFGFHLVWNWLLRFVSRLFGAPSTTTTMVLPEHHNLPTRDLTEVGNVIADNTEPGAGRRRTDIVEIFPIVADGEYDHVLTDQFQARQAPMHENIAVDAAEAEASVALLFALGAAVGLQRQLDAEATPVQEPETDVADADERRMLALASDAGLSRVATVSLGLPAGGLESNLEAEPVPRTQKAIKIQADEN